jgi:hypothetical protein
MHAHNTFASLVGGLPHWAVPLLVVTGASGCELKEAGIVVPRRVSVKRGRDNRVQPCWSLEATNVETKSAMAWVVSITVGVPPN